jgi:hypothetical protein
MLVSDSFSFCLQNKISSRKCMSKTQFICVCVCVCVCVYVCVCNNFKANSSIEKYVSCYSKHLFHMTSTVEW